MRLSFKKFIPLTFSCLVLLGVLFGTFSKVHAETASNNLQSSSQINLSSKIQSLDSFATSVQNGRSSQLVGVYAPEVMTLPVVQQPSGNAAYVSTQQGVVTQFALASQYGSTGLIAHNTLAGQNFYQLAIGDVVSLVYGDGSIQMYEINQVQSYQALNPYSPYSNFVDLSNPGVQYSSTDLFYRTYGLGGDMLVLQTCISRDGNDSWGRLFIIASPVAGDPSDYYSTYSYGKVSGTLRLNANSLSANY